MRTNLLKRELQLSIMLMAALMLALPNLHAQEKSGITISHPPRIAIVIDDLGSQLELGLKSISIPRRGPITYAVIPYTPYAKRLSKVAYDQGNEVILHMPMEPIGHFNPHQGMLMHAMQRDDIVHQLRRAIDEIPFASGFNNHMGSLFTQTPHLMQWLMHEVSLNTSLFFLDSRTSPKSVAYETAKGLGIPTLKRDVFLDSVKSVAFVEKQFAKLLNVALQQGHAIGIGHPYPETLVVLEKYLPTLHELGFELVSLSDILSSPSSIPYQYLAKTEELLPAANTTPPAHTNEHAH